MWVSGGKASVTRFTSNYYKPVNQTIRIPPQIGITICITCKTILVGDESIKMCHECLDIHSKVSMNLYKFIREVGS